MLECIQLLEARESAHYASLAPPTSRLPLLFRYEGYWSDDKAHGKGTLTYLHGDKYVGEWVAGKKQGQGTRASQVLHATDRGASQPSCEYRAHREIIFDAPMHDNLGELYYANGDMFRGEWNADRATGYGVLIYANNNRYGEICDPFVSCS